MTVHVKQPGGAAPTLLFQAVAETLMSHHAPAPAAAAASAGRGGGSSGKAPGMDPHPPHAAAAATSGSLASWIQARGAMTDSESRGGSEVGSGSDVTGPSGGEGGSQRGASTAGAGVLQAPIRHFISGSPLEPPDPDLSRFYRRLATSPPDGLPCSMGLVHLTLSSGGSSAGGPLQPGSAAPDPGPVPEPGMAVAAGDGGSSSGGPRQQLVETWAVCNMLAAGQARDLAVQGVRGALKLVPWVGLAARLPTTGSGGCSGGDGLALAGGADLAVAGEAAVAGQAFCFLPLPIPTGLPIHVNGYFELSSNRRDVWWVRAGVFHWVRVFHCSLEFTYCGLMWDGCLPLRG